MNTVPVVMPMFALSRSGRTWSRIRRPQRTARAGSFLCESGGRPNVTLAQVPLSSIERRESEP
eukprot:3831159-Prymnesium_polylepis.1